MDRDFEEAVVTYAELTQQSRDETAESQIAELDRLNRKIFKGQPHKDAIRRMNMIAHGQLLATARFLGDTSDEMYQAGRIDDEMFLDHIRQLAEDSYLDRTRSAFREQWKKTTDEMGWQLLKYGSGNGLSMRDTAVRKYEVGARLSRWFFDIVGTVPWDKYFTLSVSLFSGKLIGHALTSPSGGRLSRLDVPYDSLRAEVERELQ